MKIIDMHAHIAYADLFHEYFLSGVKQIVRDSAPLPDGTVLPASLLDRITRSKLQDPECDELVREMDAAGITKAVLLIADFGFGHDESSLTLESIYRHYAKALELQPNRFIVFGGADPRRGPDGVELFLRGIQEFGFRGLKLYPPCGYDLDDDGLDPYYEICDQFRIPVLAHTGPSLPTMQGDRKFPHSLLAASKRFEHVNFILGHAAFEHLEATLPLAEQRGNVFLETSGFQRMMQDRDRIARCLAIMQECIPDKVVFGTDWPMFNLNGTQKNWVDYFRGFSELDDSALERFFWRNAERALGTA